jgi:hypothetical protein
LIQKTVGGRGYKRVITVGLAAAVGSMGMLVSQGSAHAAVSCGSQAVTNADDGYIILGEAANLQKAPYAECGTYARANAGTKIWSWCLADNDYDNTWLWGRIDGTETYGWIFIDHASEVVQKPTRDEGFCPGEGPDNDAIDGDDRIVEEPPVPDADDLLPVQEFDPVDDVDATLPPLPGAVETDQDPNADAPEGVEKTDDSTTDLAASSTKVTYGAPITRSKVIARAKYWVQKKIAYNQDAKAWDVNHGKKYRTDCQGMVDMAWAMKSDPNTQGISPYIKQINWHSLQPGDELLKLTKSHNNHAMLFEKWGNKKHTIIVAMEEPHKGDHAKEIKLKLQYFKSNGYKAYKYNKIRADKKK